MHWNGSFYLLPLGSISSRILKMQTMIRSSSMNSCFSCLSYLSFAIIRFSYVRNCRPGCNLRSHVVSFPFISSSSDDRPVVVYGVVRHSISILHNRVSISPFYLFIYLFFREVLKRLSCSFCLTVCGRMVWSWGDVFYAIIVHNFLKIWTGEAGGIIRYTLF